ncbi:MAG TPA: hypothetical protein VGL05_19630 [Kribbella sp.]
MSGGFIVGQPAQYVVGLKGTVTEKTDDTITIDGVTVPLRLTTDGPVKHLSTEWPLDRDNVIDKIAERNRRYDTVVRELAAAGDDLRAIEQENHELLDAIAKLHEESHPDPIMVCTHEVCRRWGR